MTYFIIRDASSDSSDINNWLLRRQLYLLLIVLLFKLASSIKISGVFGEAESHIRSSDLFLTEIFGQKSHILKQSSELVRAIKIKKIFFKFKKISNNNIITNNTYQVILFGIPIRNPSGLHVKNNPFSVRLQLRVSTIRFSACMTTTLCFSIMLGLDIGLFSIKIRNNNNITYE